MTNKKNMVFKARLISDLLNFIQTDLDGLTEGEGREIFQVLALLKGIIPSDIRRWPDAKYASKKLNRYLGGSSKKPIPIDLKNAKELQSNLREFLNKLLLKQRKSRRLPHIELPEVKLFLETEDHFHFQHFPTSESLEEGLPILNFASLLDGLPVGAIRKCEECGRYFVNISLRDKIYCNPKCTWKALSRRRRERLKKHPRKYEVYLKKQREIMRLKYEEKKKAEFGPNVIIGKRAKD